MELPEVIKYKQLRESEEREEDLEEREEDGEDKNENEDINENHANAMTVIYADDNTPCCTADNVAELEKNPQEIAELQ